MKRPNNLGKNIPPRVSVRPTRILPIRAPFTEPMPPITITTKARMSTGSPIPTSTDCIAPTNAPARPANAAPRANTKV